MSVIARPPLHCCYRGHHNCFHKGSLGMSCVYRTSWLLCRPLGPLTPRRSEMESRRLSSAENTHLHTWCGNRPNVCSSSWNERWSWDGNMFEYLTVSNHTNQTSRGLQQMITLFWIRFFFFVVFEAPCASTLMSYLCKLLQQKGLSMKFLYESSCCRSTTSVCVFTHTAYTLMSLPKPCLNGSRFPDIFQSPGCCCGLSAIHSMQNMLLVYFSHILFAMRYLNKHKWHRKHSESVLRCSSLRQREALRRSSSV